jgi:alkylation response protein AidB-like acyl-CoA dehydrogenase
MAVYDGNRLPCCATFGLRCQPSSDAKNITTTAVLDGDDWVINGVKYWISEVGDPRCKIMIVMVKTNPDERNPTLSEIC